MDAGRKCWTPLDGIIREIVWQRPAESTDFRLPMVRSQQVTRSSRVAGSRFLRQIDRLQCCDQLLTPFDTQVDTLGVLGELQHALHALCCSRRRLLLEV